jgi:hypothetical protein
MKKNIIKSVFAFAFFAAIITACDTYKVCTKINSDGTCTREIYAKTDKNLTIENMGKNPFLFKIDSTWNITKIEDSKDFNIKISKNFSSISEISKSLQLNKNEFQPIAKPHESLEKHFKWFYTYYDYKVVYKSISDKIPVSINDYMTQSEQELWFRGNTSDFAGITGFEMKDNLDEIEKKFWKWYLRNAYEICFNTIYDIEKTQKNDKFINKLSTIKDSIFNVLTKNIEDKNADFFNKDIISQINIYQAFDNHFGTRYFSDFYAKNSKKIDSLIDQNNKEFDSLQELCLVNIKYELEIPGKIIATNANFNNNGILLWNINAFRFITGDYELTAQSRTANIWAFIASFLIVAIFAYLLVKVRRAKRK